MRVLVTGGAGFLGSHLCDLLVGRGDTVVCLDDLSSGRTSPTTKAGANTSSASTVAAIRSTRLIAATARSSNPSTDYDGAIILATARVDPALSAQATPSGSRLDPFQRIPSNSGPSSLTRRSSC